MKSCENAGMECNTQLKTIIKSLVRHDNVQIAFGGH